MVRYWTHAEARAALPFVKALLAEARAVSDRLQAAHEQLADLRLMHGAAVDDEDTGEHGEFTVWQERHREAREDLEGVILKFEAAGVEVKDLEMGLVDFRSQMGDHDVFLCWRADEPDVANWHPIEGGFSARRKIPDFTPVA